MIILNWWIFENNFGIEELFWANSVLRQFLPNDQISFLGFYLLFKCLFFCVWILFKHLRDSLKKRGSWVWNSLYHHIFLMADFSFRIWIWNLLLTIIYSGIIKTNECPKRRMRNRKENERLTAIPSSLVFCLLSGIAHIK